MRKNMADAGEEVSPNRNLLKLEIMPSLRVSGWIHHRREPSYLKEWGVCGLSSLSPVADLRESVFQHNCVPARGDWLPVQCRISTNKLSRYCQWYNYLLNVCCNVKFIFTWYVALRTIDSVNQLVYEHGPRELNWWPTDCCVGRVAIYLWFQNWRFSKYGLLERIVGFKGGSLIEGSGLILLPVEGWICRQGKLL